MDETSLENATFVKDIRHMLNWKEDIRFRDPRDGRFVAKIVSIFIMSKGLKRSFDYRIAKPALELAVNDVSFQTSSFPIEINGASVSIGPESLTNGKKNSE